MGAIVYELRQAVRTLGRMPGTTISSIVMLAFGIAAATTTFSAVYAAVFRPIPFEDADRLLYLQTTRQTARQGTVLLRWSPAKADALRQQARSFEAVATYTRAFVGISGLPGALSPDTAGAEQIDSEVVSAGYFGVLKAAPALGRVFTTEEEAPGHPLVILGDRLWKRQFGGDPAALGRILLVNGVPMTVIGVMPPGFDGISGAAAFWWPRGMAPTLTYREYLTTPQHFMNVIARLRRGVTLAQANAELDSIGPGLPMVPDPNAEPARWSATAIPLGDARVDASQRRALTLLLAGGGCVLLVTCVNVTMLLLTRARARRGEMAIRRALGASRQRLVQHLFVESALIAAAGGVLGIVFAGWGIAWLRRAAPAVLPSPENNYGQLAGFATPSIDGVILLFVALLALVTTMVAGVAPALAASGADPAESLAVSSRGVAGGGRGRALSVLVVSQIAIAVLLVSGALLLAGTVSRLQSDQAGFDNSALTFWINAPASRYADADGPQVVERMLDRIGRIPGVTEAAVNRCTPYGASCARTILFFAGRPAVQATAPVIGRHYVSSRYFHALGIQLRRGRLLTDDDRMGRPPVTVINETAARRFWPDEDPIGQHVWFGSAPGFTDPARPVEVVGVVADVKYWPANEAIGPDFYTSYLQFTYPSSLYVVKAADPRSVLPAIRRAVAEVDATLPIYDVQRVDQRVAEAVARPRFIAIVTAIFAISAAALAAMGVFGVMAYSVALRREELALRLALGATPRGLRGHVLGRAAQLAGMGALAGLVASVWLLRSIASLLYGVSSSDPAVLSLAVALMAAVALLSAALPAWRASTTDPMLVLRR
jgi:putative ABC transport system permease protein